MPGIDDVEVDLKIHDAYVAFSAEVVRLALLSPAVFALFVVLAGEHPTREALVKVVAPARGTLVAGLCFMAAAVLFGLAHRYLAVDFMATHVYNKREGKSSKDWRLPAASLAILAAPACLLIGSVLLFVSIYKVIGLA